MVEGSASGFEGFSNFHQFNGRQARCFQGSFMFYVGGVTSCSNVPRIQSSRIARPQGFISFPDCNLSNWPYLVSHDTLRLPTLEFCFLFLLAVAISSLPQKTDNVLMPIYIYIIMYRQRKFRSSNFRLYWNLPVGLAGSMLDSRDVLQRRCGTWEILAGRNCAKCCVFP